MEGAQIIGVKTCGDFNNYSETVNITPSVWLRIADFPGGKAYKLASFAIGNYGYVGLGTGINQANLSGFWKYDPAQDEWEDIANFPGEPRIHAHAFSIDGKGYVGGGFDVDAPYRVPLSDFYEYDPDSDSWSTIESFPGITNKSFLGIAEVVSGKCYISFSDQEFYSFDPSLPSPWTKLNNPPYGISSYNMTFSIGNEIYLVGGQDPVSGSLNSDVWCYNTSSDSWIKKNDFQGGDRYIGCGFVIDGAAYVSLGYNKSSFFDDIWKYNQSNDTWILVDTFPGAPRGQAFDFGFGSEVYIGCGFYNSTFLESVYRYNPNASR
jgi:N-acetylneuraminic acid mutarotase